MLTTIHNLDYVVLLCRDLERMKAFYSGTLGFPIVRDGDAWCEMRVGATLLTLRPRGRPYDGIIPPGVAGVQLAFRVAPDEVGACFEELAAKGVIMLEPPQDKRYGHLTFFFKDPEDNILEIYADVARRED
ncbi:MAG TPA: VOC family protein [Aggregatilineales bacterium]|nr:VOC family protein [Aggregatilineales bacterium]